MQKCRRTLIFTKIDKKTQQLSQIGVFNICNMCKPSNVRVTTLWYDSCRVMLLRHDTDMTQAMLTTDVRTEEIRWSYREGWATFTSQEIQPQGDGLQYGKIYTVTVKPRFTVPRYIVSIDLLVLVPFPKRPEKSGFYNTSLYSHSENLAWYTTILRIWSGNRAVLLQETRFKVKTKRQRKIRRCTM